MTTEASPSRPSPLPPLVPLESPWIDGQRYREAGATELATRLVLFVADPAGPWVRRHGVLLAHSAVNRATNSLAGP